jgi:hypothetical protein
MTVSDALIEHDRRATDALEQRITQRMDAEEDMCGEKWRSHMLDHSSPTEDAALQARVAALTELTAERWASHSREHVIHAGDHDRQHTQHEKDHNADDMAVERAMVAHAREHSIMDEALRAYKVEANEWRATLGDLRSQFVTAAEWNAEHRSLMTRVESMERLQVASQAESKGTSDVLGGMRNIILLMVAIVGVSLTILAFVNKV